MATHTPSSFRPDDWKFSRIIRQVFSKHSTDLLVTDAKGQPLASFLIELINADGSIRRQAKIHFQILNPDHHPVALSVYCPGEDPKVEWAWPDRKGILTAPAEDAVVQLDIGFKFAVRLMADLVHDAMLKLVGPEHLDKTLDLEQEARELLSHPSDDLA